MAASKERAVLLNLLNKCVILFFSFGLLSCTAVQAPDLPPITSTQGHVSGEVATQDIGPNNTGVTTVPPLYTSTTASSSNKQSSGGNSPGLETCGRIMDVQMMNESTPGNYAGSALGGTLGQTLYIDNSSWSNYSATKQVGVGLLGSMVGASLDQRPQISFHHRFYFRNNVGDIVQRDRTSRVTFHPPRGACVDMNTFALERDDCCFFRD